MHNYNSFNSKTNILIYGRNFHARAAFRKLNLESESFNIIGFVESGGNNLEKEYFNLPFINICDIKNIDFNYIVIAGRYINEMRNIIIANGIEKDKILEMSRSEYQPNDQSINQRTEETYDILKSLIDILNFNSIDHWFIASALLALKRNQKLAWFADVDIAIPYEQLDNISSILNNSSFKYSIEIRRHTNNGFLWEIGRVYQIMIKSKSDIILSEPAIIDIHALHLKNESVYYNLTDTNFLKTDSYHFKGKEKFKYKDLDLNIPIEAEKYLESTYGINWKTPSQFFSMSDHFGRINF